MKILEVKKIIPCLIFLTVFLFAGQEKDIKKMIFEERRIEGKIRRPQLVLIKAEQRPEFQPMVMQSYGKIENVVRYVNEEIIDASPYKEPFQFDDTRIKNYVP